MAGNRKSIWFVVSAVLVFILLVAAVFVLVQSGSVSVQLGLLMLICLLGLYVSFGILIAIYQLVSKLE